MQIGVFTVGDVTADPTTGRTPTEARADPGDGGDRAQGRGDRPRRLRDRRAPQPAVRPVLADHPARLPRRAHREAAALDGDHLDHHQRPGEDRRGLRDAAAPGRRPGGPDDGPRQHRPGVPLVRPGHPGRHLAGRRELRAAAPAVARGRRRLAGPAPHSAAGLHRHAAATGRGAAVRLARLDPQPRDRGAGRLLRRRLLPQQHLLGRRARAADGGAVPPPLRALRPRPGRPGDRRARRSGVHGEELAGRSATVPPLLRRGAGVRPRAVARGLLRDDGADGRQPAAGDRQDAGLPRDRRRLPAPAVPDGPRRAAAEDRAGAVGPAGRAGRARAAPGVRRAQAGPRAGRADPRVAARRRQPPTATATEPNDEEAVA